MRREGNRVWVLAGLVAALALAASVSSVEALDDKPGSLSFGAGVGFLSDTPDGTAFARGIASADASDLVPGVEAVHRDRLVLLF